MPSSKPKVTLRAHKEQLERWQAAAGETPLNAWITDALDKVAANGRQSAPPLSAKMAVDARPKKISPSGCTRQRFHRKGTYCKFCDTTP